MAHVITGLGIGGAEVVLCQLLESLREPKFNHTVIALTADGALSARVERSAALHHLAMRPGHMSVNAVAKLRRLLRDMRPDVIHGWMYHANLMATIATLGRSVPVVWGVHATPAGLVHGAARTRHVVRACSLLSRLPAAIAYCAVTGAQQHSAIGFSAKRARRIPNGFDTSAFCPDDDARKRLRRELLIAPHDIAIGLVARVHPMKDHANFLRAAGRFASGWPRSVFVLVGTGADANNGPLVQLADELGIIGNVRFCGARTDIAAINNALDITCSSSSWGEAFPMVLGEAMACGTPCVTTDVGDASEIVGDTGVVVPPRDGVALSAGWEKLAAIGESERSTLGLRARRRIEECFSLASVAEQYAGLYYSVANSREPDVG